MENGKQKETEKRYAILSIVLTILLVFCAGAALAEAEDHYYTIVDMYKKTFLEKDETEFDLDMPSPNVLKEIREINDLYDKYNQDGQLITVRDAIMYAKYIKGVIAFHEERYGTAIMLFTDCTIPETRAGYEVESYLTFAQGIQAMELGDYRGAIAKLEAQTGLPGYSQRREQALTVCRQKSGYTSGQKSYDDGKENSYDNALRLLNNYLSRKEGAKLEDAIEGFRGLAGYRDAADLMIYTEVLQQTEIEGCNYAAVQDYLALIKGSETALQKHISEASFQAEYPYIKSVEELQSYVSAREKEDEYYRELTEDIREQALKLYAQCRNFYDAMDRYNALRAYDPCVNGHSWKDATCTEPRTCARCGITEGKALGHVWEDATCTSPRTCSRCKATQGKALGHKWKAATVLAPKTCTVCGKTSGKAAKRVISAKSAFKVGKTVKFGYYEQDNDLQNGSEPIEWLVLEVKNNQALLISKYGLDCQKYNTVHERVTWETCTLRAWLNDTFYKTAFVKVERAAIVKKTISNKKSQGYSLWADGGNNTKDRIFLLSCSEADRYLGITKGQENNIKARAAVTAYAAAQGAYESGGYKTADGKAACNWWLRSPGSYQDFAASVWSDGSLTTNFVHNAYAAVRPALWINLESDLF